MWSRGSCQGGSPSLCWPKSTGRWPSGRWRGRWQPSSSVDSVSIIRAIPSSRSSAYLWFLSLLEESLLGLLLLALLLGEVVGGGGLLDGLLVNTVDVDARAGRDHIAGVHPSQRNTVDLEGTSDEEDTLVEVFEEDDTLATETAGKEDQNSTGLEAFPQLGRADGLASL